MAFRSSSPALAQAVLDGIRAAGGEATDLGIVSTPLLHYSVVCKNTNGAYGEVGEEGYFKKVAGAFKNIRGAVSARKRILETRGKSQGLTLVVWDSGLYSSQWLGWN